MLLLIKDNVDANKLFEITLGKSFEEFQSFEQCKTLLTIHKSALQEVDSPLAQDILEFMKTQELIDP
jgi:hypothetical protein